MQAQIEKMFTDVAKDATACSFPVRCLGALPLKDKVTSLLGLQDPLRQLYLSGAGHGVSGLKVEIKNLKKVESRCEPVVTSMTR